MPAPGARAAGALRRLWRPGPWVAWLLIAGCASGPSPRPPLHLPNVERRGLVSAARIEGVRESSGIAASRQYPGLYWTHGDTGAPPVLYAFDASGHLAGAPVRLPGVGSVDWEDIAADGADLWIADFGNNLSVRTDLCVYRLPEPDPRGGGTPARARRIPFYYPDQRWFPAPSFDFDAEALFLAFGRPYILTKHRLDTRTRLYRLDVPAHRRPVPLTPVDSFDIGGMVTAADATPDGSGLVVLTYTSVWLFRAGRAEGWFDGEVRWLPIEAGQCEGIAFDLDGTIVLTNEAGNLYRLQVEDLLPVR